MTLLNTENLNGQKWVLSPSESSLWEAVYFVISACPPAMLFFPQALAVGPLDSLSFPHAPPASCETEYELMSSPLLSTASALVKF